MPDIKIISLRDGFRRCGIEHPTGPVIHPEGTFTKAQIKKLMAEPMLVVEEVEAKAPGTLDPANLNKMTADNLKQLAVDMGLQVPEKATKLQIVELISQKQIEVAQGAAQ